MLPRRRPADRPTDSNFQKKYNARTRAKFPLNSHPIYFLRLTKKRGNFCAHKCYRQEVETNKRRKTYQKKEDDKGKCQQVLPRRRVRVAHRCPWRCSRKESKKRQIKTTLCKMIWPRRTKGPNGGPADRPPRISRKKCPGSG